MHDEVGGMAEYRFTEYFEPEVLRKHPYLCPEWCMAVFGIRVASNGNKTIVIASGRWSRNSRRTTSSRATLADKVTIHNAFPDRGFQP
jgi:hypothetical protein